MDARSGGIRVIYDLHPEGAQRHRTRPSGADRARRWSVLRSRPSSPDAWSRADRTERRGTRTLDEPVPRSRRAQAPLLRAARPGRGLIQRGSDGSPLSNASPDCGWEECLLAGTGDQVRCEDEDVIGDVDVFGKPPDHAPHLGQRSAAFEHQVLPKRSFDQNAENRYDPDVLLENMGPLSGASPCHLQGVTPLVGRERRVRCIIQRRGARSTVPPSTSACQSVRRQAHAGLLRRALAERRPGSSQSRWDLATRWRGSPPRPFGVG